MTENIKKYLKYFELFGENGSRDRKHIKAAAHEAGIQKPKRKKKTGKNSFYVINDNILSRKAYPIEHSRIN